MPTYDATCDNCGNTEIEKHMDAPFPDTCHCGGSLTRRFGVHRVIYNAPGFDGFDHQLKRHCSTEAYAKFEKEKEQILTAEARKNAIQDR